MNPTQVGFAASLRSLPREAWFLYLGTFINRFGSFVIPFLTIYVRQRGALSLCALQGTVFPSELYRT